MKDEQGRQKAVGGWQEENGFLSQWEEWRGLARFGRSGGKKCAKNWFLMELCHLSEKERASLAN